mmetsp:Transcript_18482/g.33025  ORF Transcript_18482/g.33025 Transcript_18482/m.33025 type:complete len:213 (+) Transcript_18482:121-759(+)
MKFSCFVVMAAMSLSSSSRMTAAFVAQPPTSARSYRTPTSLNLEDHIADMIDGEMARLNHLHEIEAEQILKQQQWSRMEPTLPANFDFDDDFNFDDDDADAAFKSQSSVVVAGFSGIDRSPVNPNSTRRRKDEKMAENDPMRYCADRCVTTGYCDVFEDMFEMDAREVLTFCQECVLSEEEDAMCDVPESLFDDDAGRDNGLHPSPASGSHP